MASTALVTVGTSGIGRAVANKLVQLGIYVFVVGRNVERGKTFCPVLFASRRGAAASAASL